MGALTIGTESYECRWASDVDFDGIRLEVYDASGEDWFDVSVPETGPITVNSFSREVPWEVVAAAVALARQR